MRPMRRRRDGRGGTQQEKVWRYAGSSRLLSAGLVPCCIIIWGSSSSWLFADSGMVIQ